MQSNFNKNIPCSLCGQNNFIIIGEKNDYHVVRCKDCEFMYINPQPDASLTSQIYNESYFAGGGRFGYQGINYLAKKNEWWWNHYPKKTLQKLVDIGCRKGSLIDIGCAVGFFLNCANKDGWDVSGVEISEYARSIAEKKLEKKIYSSIDEVIAKQLAFEVATFFEVIEHVHDPCQFLLDIHQLLKPNGMICLSTPNLKNASLTGGILSWHACTPPEHLNFFSGKTIKKILEKTNFQIVSIWYGSMNPLSKCQGKKIQKIKAWYSKVKPFVAPLKKTLYDRPFEWVGEKSHFGENIFVIAKKKS